MKVSSRLPNGICPLETRPGISPLAGALRSAFANRGTRPTIGRVRCLRGGIQRQSNHGQS